MANPKSYHTFLFPFLYDKDWNQKSKDESSIRYFESKLHMGKENGSESSSTEWYWTCEPFPGAYNHDTKGESLIATYATKAYFNEATKKALGSMSSKTCNKQLDGDVICKNYRLVVPDIWDEEQCGHDFEEKVRRDSVEGEVTYCIMHGEEDKTPLNLKINAIRLSAFNTGVAILRIEVENSECTGSVSEVLQKVYDINEHGRRLFPPYIEKKDDGGFVAPSLCSTSISIKAHYGNGKEDKTIASSSITGSTLDFLFKKSDGTRSGGESVDNENQRKAPPSDSMLDENCDPAIPLIKTLILGEQNDTNSDNPTNRNTNNEKWNPKPAIDDRMFVVCCIADPRIAPSLTTPVTDNKYRYQRDTEVAKRLYGLINIDSPGNSSAQNIHFVQEQLDDQLYGRWIDYGTFHAITQHSFFCVTGDESEVENTVILPFLTQYTLMATLTLAQRASLIRFDERLTQIASDFGEKKKGKDTEEDLQKEARAFAKFQGELILDEVTPQIQGIEIYAKLQKMLYIDKLNEGANRQMTKLFEINEAKFNRKVSDSGTVLAIFAGFIGIFALLFEFGNQFGTRPNIRDDLNFQPFIVAVYTFVMTLAAITPLLLFIRWLLMKYVKYEREKCINGILVVVALVVSAVLACYMFNWIGANGVLPLG